MTMPLLNMIQNSNNHLLRIIHYPAINKGVKIPRSAIHTDICLITIVFGSAFGGLELADHKGELYVPKVTDDCMVVFTSEMIESATNGYIKAVWHQVEANHNSYTNSHYSFVTGMHPRRSIELKDGKTAGEYLRDKLIAMGYNGSILNLNDN